MGGVISPHYDPMIAKLIAHGDDRDAARHERRQRGLAVRTNAAFLIRALAHPDFAAGQVGTGLIGREGDALAAAPDPSPDALSERR